ncbi:nitroreductase [Novosphingobium ginsenosidimutans]|uniref:Nitroreductase n=1 Tax=Novosphingobium ginsenosidimutans TaxID=1176536 RepID=A0A5B8S7X1_9SPHN|nr:nitroreductase [Novosphingobium ginsenosidimutans]QEA17248.1 nitroreductase [Novosphingobium ginsenosidimutans]
MNVSEAVATRRTVRAFLDKPVDQAVLRRVLEKAQNAPSGGNTQPWNATVITGEPLAKLLADVAAILPEGPARHKPEYHIYPPELDGAYAERRKGVGEAMYAALEIPRDNKMGRLMWFAKNFQAFGAPVLMLIHTPRYMGRPQWSDIGMWLQTVCLLLREEGLDSCPQEAWAIYQEQIRAVVNIPEDHIFFCGMGIGWRDPDAPVNQFPVPRAPLDEAIRWEGF